MPGSEPSPTVCSVNGNPSASSLGNSVTLEMLKPHECAMVTAIETTDEDIERLKAMGVCIGRRVELVKTGDPLILRVLGSRIGLSARLAHRVLVSTCASADHHDPAAPKA